jgi:hypothetical protein
LRRTRLGYGAAVKVVFVTGWGRSGSTLLGAILGTLPGVVALGELRHLLHPGVTCGCGRPADDCTFWLSVRTRVAAELGGLDRERFLAAQRRALAPKRVPALLRGETNADVEYAAIVMEALCRAAATEARATVVVDGSKHPADAAILGLRPGSSVVHLVRDPRATAYSWSRRRRDGQQALGMLNASLRWAEWNLLSELVARRAPSAVRVRYEDLVRDPSSTLAAVCGTAGLVPPDGLAAGGSVELGPNHMVAGNPSKFRTGTVPIVPDTTWNGDLGRPSRLLVTTATFPLMAHYGYLPRRQ